MKIKNLAALLLVAFSFQALADFSGVVVKVLDGDTVDVLTSTTCDYQTYVSAGGSKCRDGLEQLRVRLAEIDAPESKQPYGAKSKEALSALVFQKTVTVKGESRERHGRVLGHLHVQGEWVNANLVSTGAVWVYRQYSKSPLLLQLEKEAIADQVGIWSLPESERMPPWEFRRLNK